MASVGSRTIPANPDKQISKISRTAATISYDVAYETANSVEQQRVSYTRTEQHQTVAQKLTTF